MENQLACYCFPEFSLCSDENSNNWSAGLAMSKQSQEKRKWTWKRWAESVKANLSIETNWNENQIKLETFFENFKERCVFVLREYRRQHDENDRSLIVSVVWTDFIENVEKLFPQAKVCFNFVDFLFHERSLIEMPSASIHVAGFTFIDGDLQRKIIRREKQSNLSRVCDLTVKWLFYSMILRNKINKRRRLTQISIS